MSRYPRDEDGAVDTPRRCSVCRKVDDCFPMCDDQKNCTRCPGTVDQPDMCHECCARCDLCGHYSDKNLFATELLSDMRRDAEIALYGMIDANNDLEVASASFNVQLGWAFVDTRPYLIVIVKAHDFRNDDTPVFAFTTGLNGKVFWHTDFSLSTMAEGTFGSSPPCDTCCATCPVPLSEFHKVLDTLQLWARDFLSTQ